LQISYNHFEEISSRVDSGAPGLRDRIIKSADTHARLDVRSHDFPDFTTGNDAQGDLIFKKTSSFQPNVVNTNQRGSEAHVSHRGYPEKSSTTEDKSEPIRLLLRQVQHAIASMEGIAREVDREMERTVGLLALGLAEIMVNNAAETTPDVLLGNLSRALQKGHGQDIRKIRLNSADMDPAAASRARLSGLVEHIEDIRLETDVTLSRGGCVVETDCGVIDASSENQLRVLADAFQSILSTAPQD